MDHFKTVGKKSGRFSELIKRLKPKSEFRRNVLTLMTGTTIAQAIPVAASPILTRLYTPEDFGILATYIAIASIVSVIATMRYELAIVQPDKDEDAVALVTLSLIVTILVSLIVLVCVLVFHGHIVQFIGSSSIGPWLYFVPASILLTGCYQTFNYWNTRSKKYKDIAISKIYQGAGVSSGQIVLGMPNINGGFGVVVGYIVGQTLAFCYLFAKTIKKDGIFFNNTNKNKIKINAINYKKFPTYSVSGVLADSMSLQMPILVLTKFYNENITGIFSLTYRVLTLPAALISRSISQTLFQKVVIMCHETPYAVHSLIIRMFSLLLVIMLPFVVIVWFCGADLFAFVFGEPWRDAGSYASVLIFAVALRFAVSPLSIVLALDHNVKIGVLWQFTYLVTITVTLWYFSSFEIEILLLAFTVHELILYTLYLALILKGAKHIKEL